MIYLKVTNESSARIFTRTFDVQGQGISKGPCSADPLIVLCWRRGALWRIGLKICFIMKSFCVILIVLTACW